MSSLFDFKVLRILFVLLIIILISSVIILLLIRNQLNHKIDELNYKHQSIIKMYESIDKYEGKYLWEFGDISKNYYFDLFSKKVTTNKEFILFVVDSIECFSCYKFHIEKLKILNNKLLILIYSPLHSDYVKYDLPNAICITPVKNNYLRQGEFLKENLMILLIDRNGKILYVDVADKTNYIKSKLFYSKISKLFAK